LKLVCKNYELANYENYNLGKIEIIHFEMALSLVIKETIGEEVVILLQV
jgi:hypothetical protein